MKLLLHLLFALSLMAFVPVRAQKKIQLTSPNKSIVFSFKMTDKKPFYSISFKGKTLVEESALSLQIENGHFEKEMVLNKPVFRNGLENYELVVGKARQVTARYNEMTLPISEARSPFKKINIVVRAFDDGLAFRYEYPQQSQWDSYALLDENTSVAVAGDPIVHTLFLPNYTTSHEGEYSHIPWSKLQKDTLMAVPALFEFPGNVFMAITEAALLDYAGMYLMKQEDNLVSKLSPLPGQSAVKVKANLPHRSPWRAFLIGDKMGTLIESNILTNLNEPNKLNDISWLKPGKTTFPWWNGNITPDTIAAGNNFVTQQYYIDFCARNGLEYHSVVEYGLHQWYVDDGVNFQPGPNPDVTRPVPGLNMKEVCDYAKSKGVEVRVWVHWAALYPKLDSAFAIFERWGLSGMMIDFMDRDDQEMVNMQTEMLEKAAKHKLHIQFHGSYKPTGLHRTYPNEFTREGTLNYETNKWDSAGLSPDHDINIPFTRMLAGSTDYHLGGFRAVPREKFAAQHTRPLMLGTRCHMLAMYVVLESYLGMVCDYPEAYEGQAGFDFIKKVPTIWDETRVLDASVGEFIVIARKKNDDWYIGAITNSSARELSIPLSFLGAGTYQATTQTDSPNDPNALVESVQQINKDSKLNVRLAAGGGMV